MARANDGISSKVAAEMSESEIVKEKLEILHLQHLLYGGGGARPICAQPRVGSHPIPGDNLYQLPIPGAVCCNIHTITITQ